ncbi:MAG: hypothetical protein WDO74_32320 [Pseudomonadota bacterium]
MWRYLARTIVQRLLLLVVISIVSHTVIHLAPGEPTEVDAMNPMMKAEGHRTHPQGLPPG